MAGLVTLLAFIGLDVMQSPANFFSWAQQICLRNLRTTGSYVDIRARLAHGV